MIVYRLAKAKYAHDFSGVGAGKTGGRWNSKGVRIIYTSESRALCATEVAVHMPLGLLPLDFQIITIEIPESVKIFNLPIDSLPVDWRSIPHSNSTQEVGDNFVFENNAAVFRVPSVVVRGDFNYLLNPNHNLFAKIEIIKVEPFVFDSRLFN